MTEPTLIILAAGMGSRFGGLKQITAVDERGHAIIDFSLYDAYRAGFRRVVFIIKEEMRRDFHAAVGCRAEKYFDLHYAYQRLDDLPQGFSVPAGREKPWGTAHATLSARHLVDGPFAALNADDFYGAGAYRALYDFLSREQPEGEQAMVAYELRNTVTENGTVARGVCHVEDGYLLDVVERTRIAKQGRDAAYTEDGETWIPLSGDLPVSMNCWAFQGAMMGQMAQRFPAWLEENLKRDPLRCEYFLPYVANAAIQDGSGRVRVLPCREVWHGVTYREDLPDVVAYIQQLRREGLYPESLLD